MKNVFLLLICLIISLSACHKSVPAYYPVNATVKADFDYKDGTYWIYQDALSGEVDSFVVWTSGDGPVQGNTLGNPTQIYSFEDIGIGIHQYGTYGVAEWYLELIETSITLSTPYIGYDPFIVYPFVVGPVSTGSYSVNVISILPTYSLSGQTFETVEEISQVDHYVNNSTVPPSNVNFNDTFYISPTAGIIKMILNHPLDTTYNQHRVWELQRYNIVK